MKWEIIKQVSDCWFHGHILTELVVGKVGGVVWHL
jgi:hypothetical protein